MGQGLRVRVIIAPEAFSMHRKAMIESRLRETAPLLDVTVTCGEEGLRRSYISLSGCDHADPILEEIKRTLSDLLTG